MSWKLAFLLYVSIDIGLTIGLFLRRRQQYITLNARANHPTSQWTPKDTENSKYPYDYEADNKFLKIISDYDNK